ncbi:hypothetical protein DIU36_27935, partial [Mucilaginibacter rubeus]
MLGESERYELLESFNATGVRYAEEQETVIEHFRTQALRSPDALAVVFGEERMSYRELDERSTRLGHYLQEQGVGRESLVPICVDRGLWMITGILGILKAGGAYVPVDPSYPSDRISYMLSDTGGALLLSERGVLGSGVVDGVSGVRFIALDELEE